MSLIDYLSRQMKKPSGIFGQVIISRLLNRGNRIINQKTLELLSMQPVDHILEVGFGGGDLLSRILPVVQAGSIQGVDYSPEMVSYCIKRFAAYIKQGKLNLQCASTGQLPFPDNRFNKVCTVNTLYFWDNTQQVLAEFYRVLQNKGLLVLSFVDRDSMAKNPLTQNHFTLYDQEQVAMLLSGAGFQDINFVRFQDGKNFFYCATGQAVK